VNEQNGGAERGASLWTARGLTPLFPRPGSDAQIHRCPAKQPSAFRPRGALRDFVHRSSAKPKQRQALSITHNFPGLGEDFPGGGDVVETLEAAPQDDPARSPTRGVIAQRSEGISPSYG